MMMAKQTMILPMFCAFTASLTVRGFTPPVISKAQSVVLRSFSSADSAQQQHEEDIAMIQNYHRQGHDEEPPLLPTEGVFAVHKPLEWTSSNVVSYIRGILERDARARGLKPAKVGSRRKNRRVVKVGHGGTLDPLASGVLVIGVGKGTKQLEKFLTGSKAYTAEGELGFETTTLDMEGNVTKRESFDHITADTIEGILPMFTGKILQVPPIFSAIQKDGKRLYKEARKGASEEDLQIDPREVEVKQIQLVETNIPRFRINIECGGGVYIRSLIRDMGRHMESAATTYSLERTKHGPFTAADCLPKDDWDAENIFAAIEKAKARLDLD